MQTIKRNTLVKTTLLLAFISLAIFSCKTKDIKPGGGSSGDLNFKTMYHIELNDGSHTEIFEGTYNPDNRGHGYGETSIDADNDNRETAVLMAYRLENVEDNCINILGTFKANGDLCPIGDEDNGNYAWIHILLTGRILQTELLNDSLPTNGSHTISNINRYPIAERLNLISYRYDFSNVKLEDAVTGEQYTATGYLECVTY